MPVSDSSRPASTLAQVTASEPVIGDSFSVGTCQAVPRTLNVPARRVDEGSCAASLAPPSEGRPR